MSPNQETFALRTSAPRHVLQLVETNYINSPTGVPNMDIDGETPLFMSHIVKRYESLAGKSASVVITLSDAYTTNNTRHYVAVACAPKKYQVFQKIDFRELLDCVYEWLRAYEKEE